jgi:thiamine-phosphate pyrophosphorylase
MIGRASRYLHRFRKLVALPIASRQLMYSTPAIRILDAAMNRAGEGLRVVEDYARFVCDDRFLTRQIKALRHDFAAATTTVAAADRHAARDTDGDIGTTISNQREGERGDAWDVCAAGFKRAEQALRSLEEYGKLIDVSVGRQAESLRYRLYTLEKAFDVGRSSRDRLEGVRLCVLVDGRDSAAEFDQLISDLVQAGVDMIQLRDKRLDDRTLIGRGRLLREKTRGTRTLCIINDRADIAAAVHADGVHLGQEDIGVKDARAIVGTRMLTGVSTHNIDQARAAVLDGANYLGAGPTFPSHTKEFESFAGLEYLREVATEIRLPTFAIGGITAHNLRDVLASKISRIAVSAAVTQARNPSAAIHELSAILNDVST